MMEERIKSKLSSIFGMRAKLEAVGEHQEQDVMFISLSRNRSTFKGSNISYRIEGDVTIYTQINKIPIGFFNKKIDLANADDKSSFFFFNIDENNQYSIQNLCEKKLSFIYIDQEQFDPSKGQITELNLGC